MGYLTGTKWGDGTGTTTITWSFARLQGDMIHYAAQITDSAYRGAVTAAFDAWEAVANIDFVQLSDDRTNDIRLGWSDIDGKGSTLGVARWSYRGDTTLEAEIEFDRAESWAPQSGGNGTLNFYAVALHEIGHAIGLAHADGARSSIMYPYLTSNAALSAEDIAEIQSLYGKPVVASPAPSLSPAHGPAHTPTAATSPDMQPTASTTQDVFRFYNPGTGVHFYTASAGERDAVLATLPQFKFEGNVFDVSGTHGDVAVFRFNNTQTGAHFYTASEVERDVVLANYTNFAPEGVAFNAYADSGESGEHQALHRFLRLDTGTHFYTADEREKANVEATLPNYRYEGVACYVDVA